MNILDALKGLDPQKPNERKLLSDGMLSIADAVFYVALWKGGVEQAIIDDLMLENRVEDHPHADELAKLIDAVERDLQSRWVGYGE